jgi:hypothetical protein
MADPLLKFIESVCVQTAVYWGNPRNDGYGGTTYDSPVEIKCRWDGTTKRVTNNQGVEVVSQAEVLVTQDMDADGLLYLGALSDLTTTQQNDPAQVVGAYKIQRVDKNPLFRSTSEFVRTVYL